MELWDIYDENKQPTGRTMKKNDWHMKPGEFHLTVLGVIRRPDGKFLITQRVMTKAWAPGAWEVSGGGVMAGETSAHLFSYQRINPDEGDNYFVDIYRFEMDVKEEDVHIQTAEAMGFQFADLDTIKKLAGQDKFLHYNSIKQAFEA